MNREEFKKKVIADVRDYMPTFLADQVEVINEDILKSNDTWLDAVVLRVRGSKAAPTFYLDEMYDAYIHGISFDEIVKDLADSFIDTLKVEPPRDSFVEESLVRYENFALKILNKEKNLEYLKDAVYREVGYGMVVALDICMPDGNGGEWRAKVTQQIAEAEGIDTELALNLAIRVTEEKYPPMLIPLDENILDPEKRKNLLDPSIKLSFSDKTGMFILKTEHLRYGSIAFVYSNIFERIRNILENDFYIVPNSTEEMIIVPDAIYLMPWDLKELLHESNRLLINRREYLSDDILKYTREDGTISIWEE